MQAFTCCVNLNARLACTAADRHRPGSCSQQVWRQNTSCTRCERFGSFQPIGVRGPHRSRCHQLLRSSPMFMRPLVHMLHAATGGGTSSGHFEALSSYACMMCAVISRRNNRGTLPAAVTESSATETVAPISVSSHRWPRQCALCNV